MKNRIIHLCLWILVRLGWEPQVPPIEDPRPEPDFPLPLSMESHRTELALICEEERPLLHGSTDILGDDWLRFRRIASLMKKSNRGLPVHDIFQGILVIYREMDHVSTKRILDVDERSGAPDSNGTE